MKKLKIGIVFLIGVIFGGFALGVFYFIPTIRFVQEHTELPVLVSRILEGNVSAVEEILKDGADPNESFSCSYSSVEMGTLYLEKVKPLMIAPLDGNLTPEIEEKCFHLILNAGGDLDVRDADGRDVLMYVAMRRGSESIVRFLLKSKRDWLSHRDRWGRSAVHYAVEGNSPSILKILVEHGFDPNLKNISDETPLLLAAFRSSPEMVETLLSAGADPNLSGTNGKTPLMCALFSYLSKDFNVAEILLKSGARLDARDSQGHTALMQARGAGLLIEETDEEIQTLTTSESDSVLPIFPTNESPKKRDQIALFRFLNGNKKVSYGNVRIGDVESYKKREVILYSPSGLSLAGNLFFSTSPFYLKNKCIGTLFHSFKPSPVATPSQKRIEDFLLFSEKSKEQNLNR